MKKIEWAIVALIFIALGIAGVLTFTSPPANHVSLYAHP